MDYTLLLQQFTASNTTDELFLEAYNDPIHEYFVAVSSVDVATYLMETISHHSTPNEPVTIYHMLSLTYRDDAFPPPIRAYAENIIDLATGVDRPLTLHGNPLYTIATMGLVGAGRWNQAEADGLLNFGKRFRSQSEIDHGRETTQTDLNVMRNQPIIATLQTQRDALAQEIAVLDAQMADLWAGVVSEVG